MHTKCSKKITVNDLHIGQIAYIAQTTTPRLRYSAGLPVHVTKLDIESPDKIRVRSVTGEAIREGHVLVLHGCHFYVSINDISIDKPKIKKEIPSGKSLIGKYDTTRGRKVLNMLVGKGRTLYYERSDVLIEYEVSYREKEFIVNSTTQHRTLALDDGDVLSLIMSKEGHWYTYE